MHLGYCGERWSDTQQDDMICCTASQKWAYTECAGICVNDYCFTCDFMVDPRSSQCSTTGVTKAVVCIIPSVGRCI